MVVTYRNHGFSHICHFRDRLRLQKKFQKQFGVRQKWDQKSQVDKLMSIVPPLMVRVLWLHSQGSSSCTNPDVSLFLSLRVPPLAAQQKPRDSSVEVRSDWEVKEEMDFPRLMKMRYLEVSEPQDM